MKSLLKKMILSSVAFAALLGATPKAEATVQDVKNLCIDSIQTCARTSAKQLPSIGTVMLGTAEMAGSIVYAPLMEQGFNRACQGVSDIINTGYNEYFGFCLRHTTTDKIMRAGLTAGAYCYGGFLFAAGTALTSFKNNSADILYHHLPSAGATGAIINTLVPLALSPITGEGSIMFTAVEGLQKATSGALNANNATIPYAETAAKMITSQAMTKNIMFAPWKFLFGRKVKPKIENSIKEFSRT